MNQQFHSYIQEMKDVCSHKNLYVNVDSNTTHNSPKVETPQLFISWWMVLQNVV